jgi:hypothetical protein
MTKLTPFDFVNSITFKKDEDLLTQESERQYIPFLINRALSYFPDTVLYANDMNQYPSLDKYVQYKYYLHAIPRRKRFAKWGKKINDEDVVSVSKVYQLNTQKATEMLRVLSEEQLKTIRDISNSLG